MKKLLSIVLSLLVVLAIMFSFAACGNDSDKSDDESDKNSSSEVSETESTIEGSWYGVMDMEAIVGMKLDFPIIMTFEDGTFTIDFDESKKDDFKKDLADFTYDMLAEQGLSKEDVDASLAEQETDMDTYVEESLDTIVESMGSENKYEADDEKIYTWQNGGEKSESTYITYELDGKKLTLTKGYGDEDVDIYPITLEKK